jgi:hypothetical protein
MVSSAGHHTMSILLKSGGIARRMMSAMPKAPAIKSCGRARTFDEGYMTVE